MIVVKIIILVLGSLTVAGSVRALRLGYLGMPMTVTSARVLVGVAIAGAACAALAVII